MARPDILGGLERVLNPYILGKETLRDIFELRLILEMVSQKCYTTTRRNRISGNWRQIVEKQLKLKELSKEDEIEFHAKLYEMSGNDTLKRFQILLFPVFDYVYKYSKHKNMNKLDPKDRISHADLLQVLKTGTPEDFRKAMFSHLSPYYTSSM